MEFYYQSIAPYNRFHAIKRNKVIFYDTADAQSQSQALVALKGIQDFFDSTQVKIFRESFSIAFQQKVQQKIEQEFNNGNTVVLDCMASTPEIIKSWFPEARIVKVLVFCPLAVCCERLRKRNQEAITHKNLYNERVYKHFLTSYMNFYHMTGDCTYALQASDKQEFEAFFDKLDSECSYSEAMSAFDSFVTKELTHDELTALRKKFIREDLQGMVFIEPKKNYDIVLDTSKMSPQEAAQTVIDTLGKA